jgi:hypothetical protein
MWKKFDKCVCAFVYVVLTDVCYVSGEFVEFALRFIAVTRAFLLPAHVALRVLALTFQLPHLPRLVDVV